MTQKTEKTLKINGFKKTKVLKSILGDNFFGEELINFFIREAKGIVQTTYISNNYIYENMTISLLANKDEHGWEFEFEFKLEDETTYEEVANKFIKFCSKSELEDTNLPYTLGRFARKIIQIKNNLQNK